MQGVIYLIIHVKSPKNSMLVACTTNFYNHKNLLNRFGKGQRVSISLMFKVSTLSVALRSCSAHNFEILIHDFILPNIREGKILKKLVKETKSNTNKFLKEVLT